MITKGDLYFCIRDLSVLELQVIDPTGVLTVWLGIYASSGVLGSWVWHRKPGTPFLVIGQASTELRAGRNPQQA